MGDFRTECERGASVFQKSPDKCVDDYGYNDDDDHNAMTKLFFGVWVTAQADDEPSTAFLSTRLRHGDDDDDDTIKHARNTFTTTTTTTERERNENTQKHTQHEQKLCAVARLGRCWSVRLFRRGDDALGWGGWLAGLVASVVSLCWCDFKMVNRFDAQRKYHERECGEEKKHTHKETLVDDDNEAGWAFFVLAWVA